MTIEELLQSQDAEDIIDGLEDKELIQLYQEFKIEYELNDDSWYDNTEPYIYDIYHTMEAEIVQRGLDSLINEDFTEEEEDDED